MQISISNPVANGTLARTGPPPEPAVVPKSTFCPGSIGIFNPSPTQKVVLIPIKVGFWEKIAGIFSFLGRT